MSDQQKVAFEFGRATVVRAGRRVLDEVTANSVFAGPGSHAAAT